LPLRLLSLFFLLRLLSLLFWFRLLFPFRLLPLRFWVWFLPPFRLLPLLFPFRVLPLLLPFGLLPPHFPCRLHPVLLPFGLLPPHFPCGLFCPFTLFPLLLGLLLHLVLLAMLPLLLSRMTVALASGLRLYGLGEQGIVLSCATSRLLFEACVVVLQTQSDSSSFSRVNPFQNAPFLLLSWAWSL
jgi:hypothetical protein